MFSSSDWNLTRTSSLKTNWEPRFLVLLLELLACLSDGQAIRSVNTSDGKERWKQQLDGAVSALSMAQGGSLIVAGTETGNIAGLGSNGNLLWSYASNPENRQAAGITCSAVSDKGSVIAAGTADGKILYLDSKGELKGSSVVHEYIRHIAMSTDGSVVVATSETGCTLCTRVEPLLASPSLTVTMNNHLPSPTESPAPIQRDPQDCPNYDEVLRLLGHPLRRRARCAHHAREQPL
jgi:WD40 repeat protein